LSVAEQVRKPKKAGFMAINPHIWPQAMATAGLKPEDFIDPTNPPPAGVTPDQTNFWQHVRMRTTADRATDPAGVLNTMKLWAAMFPTRFGNARAAIRQAFGTNVLVTANVHDAHFFKGMLLDVDPWLMYSQQEKLDVPQACDYNAVFPPGEEFMIDLMRSALQPHDKPVDAYFASQCSYMTKSRQSLRLRAFGAIGAGARSISFYEYGPRYRATENWYDTDRPRLQTIGDICHAIGWAEDILLAGRPRPAKIAIMYARESDMWDALDIGDVYADDRRNIYYLLRNSHFDVDFINEACLPDAAQLDRLKVIFMAQRCLTAKAAAHLLEWVERGGTLVGILGAGRLDDLARPHAVMTKAFGLADLEVDEAAAKSRTNAPPSRRIGSSEGPETRGTTATRVTPAGSAKIMAKFDDGSPAVIQQARGKGRLIYAAFLPGSSYHKDAIFVKYAGVLTGMQEAIRKLVTGWLPPEVTPYCKTDNSNISARLIEAPQGAAVVLINATGTNTVDKVVVSIQATQYTKAVSLEKGALTLARNGDRLDFTLPLDLTDIVRLE